MGNEVKEINRDVIGISKVGRRRRKSLEILKSDHLTDILFITSVKSQELLRVNYSSFICFFYNWQGHGTNQLLILALQTQDFITIYNSNVYIIKMQQQLYRESADDLVIIKTVNKHNVFLRNHKRIFQKLYK